MACACKGLPQYFYGSANDSKHHLFASATVDRGDAGTYQDDASGQSTRDPSKISGNLKNLSASGRPRILVYTTLFPNSVQPLLGNFVLERMRHLLKWVDISVVAPVPYLPRWVRLNRRWLNWARVPYEESFGG